MQLPRDSHSSRLPEENDYYQVLGVPFDSSEETIRKQYHGVVRTLHPDRRRPGGGGSEALERFHQVQSAWRCLSDPTRRLLYDLRNFGCSSLDAEGTVEGVSVTAEEKLTQLQKEQALRDVSNMKFMLDRILRREQAAQGVIIRIALYGDLRLREDSFEECSAGQRTIEAKDLIGPAIDVALPLQCLVEQHTIVLPGGASASKADLPGFYNPAPLDTHVELGLYVLYEFRGHLHEVIVGDRETLSLPFRKHAIPAGKVARGPFSPANIALLRRDPSADKSKTGAPTGKTSKAATNHTWSGPSVLNEAYRAQTLKRAVVAYRLQRLHSPYSGEVSPREFIVVVLTGGIALALAACLAVRRRCGCNLLMQGCPWTGP